MEEAIDKSRLSAIHAIMDYRDSLLNLPEEEYEITAKIFACNELIDLLASRTSYPIGTKNGVEIKCTPIDIIEMFGWKMKSYSEINPMFQECVVACEVILDILGG